MEELLLSLLYVFAEALLEALLEIVGEAVFALISRATGNLFPALLKSNRFLTTIGFAVVGVAAGFSTLLVFPHRLVQPSRFHGISLLISPLIAGLVMSQVGRAVRRQGLEAVEIESFGYGFIFALGMALIRFVFVK
jgi:hypothetical protein